MVRGADGKWRSMANERLYESKMLLGALYRSELAQGLSRFGYGIEKTHADGRFEIAGVPRQVIEAFSTRRAEIEAAVAERGGGATADNQRLAQRAALMSRTGSPRARAGSMSTAARTSSFAPATASAGPATTMDSVSSTARRPRSRGSTAAR